MAENKAEQEYIELIVELMQYDFDKYVQRRQKNGEKVNPKKAKREFYDGLVNGTVKTVNSDAYTRAQAQAKAIREKKMIDFAREYIKRNSKAFENWLQKNKIKKGSISAKSSNSAVAFFLEAAKVTNSSSERVKPKKEAFEAQCKAIERDTGITYNLNLGGKKKAKAEVSPAEVQENKESSTQQEAQAPAAEVATEQTAETVAPETTEENNEEIRRAVEQFDANKPAPETLRENLSRSNIGVTSSPEAVKAVEEKISEIEYYKKHKVKAKLKKLKESAQKAISDTKQNIKRKREEKRDQKAKAELEAKRREQEAKKTSEVNSVRRMMQTKFNAYIEKKRKASRKKTFGDKESQAAANEYYNSLVTANEENNFNGHSKKEITEFKNAQEAVALLRSPQMETVNAYAEVSDSYEGWKKKHSRSLQKLSEEQKRAKFYVEAKNIPSAQAQETFAKGSEAAKKHIEAEKERQKAEERAAYLHKHRRNPFIKGTAANTAVKDAAARGLKRLKEIPPKLKGAMKVFQDKATVALRKAKDKVKEAASKANAALIDKLNAAKNKLAELGKKKKEEEIKTITINPGDIQASDDTQTNNNTNREGATEEVTGEDISELVKVLSPDGLTPYVAASDVKTDPEISENWMEGIIKDTDFADIIKFGKERNEFLNRLVKKHEEELTKQSLLERLAGGQAKLTETGLTPDETVKTDTQPVKTDEQPVKPDTSEKPNEPPTKTDDDSVSPDDDNGSGGDGGNGGDGDDGDNGGDDGNDTEEEKEVELPGASSLSRSRSTAKDKDEDYLQSLFDVVRDEGDSASFKTTFKQKSTKATFTATTIVSSKEKMGDNLLVVRDGNGAVLTLQEKTTTTKKGTNVKDTVIVREDLLSPAMREKLKDYAKTRQVKGGGTITEYHLPVESVAKTDTKITRYKIAGQNVTIDADPRNIVVRDVEGKIKPTVYNAGDKCFEFEESEKLLSNIFDSSNRKFNYVQDNSKKNAADTVLSMTSATDINRLDPKYIAALIRTQKAGPDGVIRYPGLPEILYTTIKETPIVMLRDANRNLYIYGRDIESDRETRPTFMKISSVAFLTQGHTNNGSTEVVVALNRKTKKPLMIGASITTETSDQILAKYEGEIPTDAAERNALAIAAINEFATPTRVNRNDKAVQTINGVKYYERNGIESNNFDSNKGYTEHQIAENEREREIGGDPGPVGGDHIDPGVDPGEDPDKVIPDEVYPGPDPEPEVKEDPGKKPPIVEPEPKKAAPKEKKSSLSSVFGWILLALGVTLCLAGTIIGLGALPAAIGLSLCAVGSIANGISAFRRSEDALLAKEADKAVVEDLLEKRKERVLDKINTVDLDKLNKREQKAVSEALLKLEAGHELSNSEISKIDKIFTKRDVYTEKKPAADAAAKPYEESTEVIKAEMDATAEVTNDRKPISEITNTDLLTKEEKELLAKLDSDKPLTETDKEGIYRIIAREPMLSDKTSFFGFTTRGEVTSNSAEDFARGYVEKEEDRIAENTATVKKWMDVQTRINTEAVNPEETTEEERAAGENFFKIMGGDKRSETQQLAVDIFNALQDKLIADATPVKTEEVKEVENLAGGGSVEGYNPEEEKPEYETPAPKETEEQKKEAEKEKEGDPAAAAGGPGKTN